jgi:hypothetical protein
MGGFRTLEERGVVLEMPPMSEEVPAETTTQAPQGGGFVPLDARTAPPPAQTAPVPTSGEPQPAPQETQAAEGGNDSIMSFLGLARDLLPAAAYNAVSTVPLVGDMVQGLANNAAVAPAQTGSQATGLTGADRLTYGLLDTLAAGSAQMGTLNNGGTFDEAIAAGEGAATAVNENLRQARDDFTVASLIGDTIGVAASGTPIAYGVAKLPGIGRSLFLTAGTGAAIEEGLYSLNSDGTLAEAATNAGVGFMLGGLGAKVMQGLGVVGGLIGGRSNTRFRQELGSEIYRTIQARHLRETGEELSMQQASALLARSSSDDLLTDLYPELRPMLRELAQTGDDRARDRMLNIIRRRNDLTFDYHNSVTDTIRGSARTQEQFTAYLDGLQSQLRPQYTRLFDDMDAAQWARPADNVRDSITRRFNTNMTGHGDDLSYIMGRINEVSSGRPRVRFRELDQLRKDIQSQIRTRIVRNANGTNDPALPIGNLRSANEYVRGLLATNDEYARLLSTYGDIEDARTAFEYGSNTVRRTNILGEDADLFYQGNMSSLVAEGLTEGGRFGLLTQARGSTDPAAALRAARIQDLGALIGQENADEILRQATNLSRQRDTLEAAFAGASGAADDGASAFRGQTMLDLQVASRGLTGQEGGVGVAFAGRRLLERALGSNPTPYPGEAARMARQGAEVFAGAPRDGASVALDAAANRNMPTVLQMLGASSSVQNADAIRNSDVVQEDIPYGYGVLNDMLQEYFAGQSNQ